MNPNSDLSQMFINNLILYSITDAEKQKAILNGSNPALKFIVGLIHPSRYLAIREILSEKMVPKNQMRDRMGLELGGKRHSKFKRKSKKINRKKSRRRHRRRDA